MYLTDREWGWVAGIIDGEGHLSLYSSGPNAQDRANLRYLQPRLGVGNTSLAMLERLQNWFGGGISTQGKPRKLTHQEAFQWQLYQRVAIQEILEQTVENLTEKQERGRLMLSYLQDCPPLEGGERYTTIQHELAQTYFTRLKSLNAMRARRQQEEL